MQLMISKKLYSRRLRIFNMSHHHGVRHMALCLFLNYEGFLGRRCLLDHGFFLLDHNIHGPNWSRYLFLDHKHCRSHNSCLMICILDHSGLFLCHGDHLDGHVDHSDHLVDHGDFDESDCLGGPHCSCWKTSTTSKAVEQGRHRRMRDRKGCVVSLMFACLFVRLGCEEQSKCANFVLRRMMCVFALNPFVFLRRATGSR